MNALPEAHNPLATAGTPFAEDGLNSSFAAPTLRSLAHSNLLRPYLYHMILEETLAKEPLDPALTRSLLTNFRQSNDLRDEDGEQKFLQKMGWTEKDYLYQVELPHRIADHCSKHFSTKAEARFLDRKNQLDQVVYSLIRVKDGTLARELYLRVEEGEASFGELAEEYSEGPEKNSKGVVGPAPLSQGHPQLVQRLRSAAIGELIAPFSVEQFWLVARLERHQPATLDDAMRQRMAQEMFDLWIQEEVTIKIKQLCSAPLNLPV